MDFLKSAVASAISNKPAFGFVFGERVDFNESIWSLHNGTKRDDGSVCSIFSFDCSTQKVRLPLARNALRKLRTLRHPGVIKVLDTLETETNIYIATERLTPLSWHVRRKSLTEEAIKWGLFSVAKTMKFINNDASSVHGALRVASIFTSDSGEWKLGGFEVLSSMNDEEAIIYAHASLVPDANRYMAPEVVRSGWEVIKRNPLHAVDAYNLGTLMVEVCNGAFTGPEQAGQTRNIPPSMQASYKNLVNSNPKVRRSIAQFLDQGQRIGGFFQTPLIQLTEGTDNLSMKNEAERDEFVAQLEEVLDDFPEEFLTAKVLPELLKSVEFGGGGPKVFSIVIKIGRKLQNDDYESKITPVIVRLFTSPDRAIRVCLLDNLPLMIDHLPQKLVNDKVFPQMVTGFTDVMPLVREQTVKAVLTVVPKLSDRVINGELLRHLAKTANDEQPGIRTNTTICLGKIARHLSNGTRTKVLTAAFSRALRDPFVHARNAALLALSATSDLFGEEDCATKLLPAICPALVDKEKMIRDQAGKAMDAYMMRVRAYQNTLPDTLLPPQSGGQGSSVTSVKMAGTPSAEPSSWTGWAISSFTNKLAAASGQIQSGSSGSGSSAGTVTTMDHRSASVPPNRPSDSRPHLDRTSTQTAASTASFGTSKSSSGPFANGVNLRQEEEDHDVGGNSAWDESLDDPWDETAQTTTNAPTETFDDQGEPDFAGWLNAQKTNKPPSKKPLPKGLSKAAPAAGPIKNSSARTLPQANRKIQSQIEAKPGTHDIQEPVEEDGWGDAWE